MTLKTINHLNVSHSIKTTYTCPLSIPIHIKTPNSLRPYRNTRTLINNTHTKKTHKPYRKTTSFEISDTNIYQPNKKYFHRLQNKSNIINLIINITKKNKRETDLNRQRSRPKNDTPLHHHVTGDSTYNCLQKKTTPYNKTRHLTNHHDFESVQKHISIRDSSTMNNP